MAVAVLICGGCGERIAPERIGTELAACPSCGERLELPAGLGLTDWVACEMCGVKNPVRERACRSCGAKLPGKHAEEKASRKKPGARRSRTESAGASVLHSVEPWQIVSGVAVLGLVAFLAASEWPRGKETPSSGPSPVAVGSIVPDLAGLENAVASSPNDAGSLLRLANALHDSRQFPRATEMYSRYLALAPGDPDARVDLGTCFYEMALVDSARSGALLGRAAEEMKAVAAKNPAHQPASYNLGIVHLAMGKLEEAGGWFRKARGIDKNSALGKKAQMLLEQHQQFTPPQ